MNEQQKQASQQKEAGDKQHMLRDCPRLSMKPRRARPRGGEQ